MRTLYPAIASNAGQWLQVSDLHQLYVEESGNPLGIPVVVVHGGPGAGVSPEHRRFFDPECYRIILFDQRGTGQSRPHAELADNNTQALIADMEQIRITLGIERWLVFGGSWGSTLGLCYAIEHPESVLGLVLRGLFLGRQQDLHWLYQPEGGAAQLFPDYYRDFLVPLEGNTDDLLNRYYRLLTSDNELARLNAARAWAIWEGRISTLLPRNDADSYYGEAHSALALSRLECHYFVNDCFLKENHIVEGIERVRSLPAILVHGRYDAICKPAAAATLASCWPELRLQIVPGAGHSAFEPGIIDALIKATDHMAKELAVQ
ncbi:prolyl aminopeptidase [Oceanimonas baumannii]|uniref:Proline iminopeptidase n=1 Tax=Oceanimonas baumannii TaxID=129578 RepID=A0A235CIQ1_9GAMM|nr:prolyl aminopeptidase [Oceanimonas baumannii]OYD24279.1 prolyl aminopeptidase [Oceanimonas baumannii]TDW59010.1 proline iminopeptidase [Oceanimonas baumannii]